MNITLRQLTVFEAVARHLSFTRAAEELHLSQPGVSMQVRQLEQEVGLELYQKVGRGIQLTEAGREMLLCSERVSREMQEADEIFTALKGMKQGHFQISVTLTAKHFVPRLLAAFSKKNPGVTFSLDIVNHMGLMKQLHTNQTELAITGNPPEPDRFHAEVFRENPQVMIASPDHPLAKASQTIPLQRILHETFVVREAEAGTRMVMDHFFAERGLVFKPGMEMTSNEAIKHAVEAGLGLGIVPLQTMELELKTGRLKVLPVEDFPIPGSWYLVTAKDRKLSPVAEAFRAFVMAAKT